MRLNNLWQRTAAKKEFAQVLYPHIGYGFLDRRSIRWEGDLLKADYRMDGQKVLEISKSNASYHLQEYYGDTPLGFAGGISLDIAIKYAYARKDEYYGDRFQYLVIHYLQKHHVLSTPLKGKTDFNPVFVPDALRLGLEIIETPEIRDGLDNFIHSLQERSPVKFSYKGLALLLTLTANEEVRTEERSMVEFTMPVAYVPLVIPQLVRMGILIKRPARYVNRAYLVNYQMKAPNKQLYRLNRDPAKLMLLVARDASKITDRDKLIRDFRNSAMAYIQAEKNQN